MSFFNAGTVERRAIGGLTNPFESPAIPLSSIGLEGFFDLMTTSKDTGESVTPDNAMVLPTVFRCVGLLATVIAGCELRTYRNPGKVEVFPKILDKGTSDMTYTQYELWELVVAHLALWGNAYVRKIRNAADQIVDLIPIYPGAVTPRRVTQREAHITGVPAGTKLFEVKRMADDGTEFVNGTPLIYTDFEIMHIPGLGFDGVQGLSPIQYAARTIGTAMAGDRLAAKFYSKGSILSGIIKVKAPLADQAQADAIRAKWMQKMAGTMHAAEVGVLDAATDFQQLTIPPEALQFLESRRWQTNEIARMYGIPPHLVGDVERSTSWGAGIESQNVGFVSYTIAGWTNRIEQRISREVIGINKQYTEFNLDRLMRGSMSERFTAYVQAISAGWMTRNEARINENMVPLPGLDEPVLALNMGAGDKNLISSPPPSPNGNVA